VSAYFFVGVLRQYRREDRAVQESAEHEIALSNEHGFILQLAFAIAQRGWAMSEQGLERQGIEQMQEGLAALQAAGAEIGRPRFLSYLAEAWMKIGRFYEALTGLNEAQSIADKNEDRTLEAETHRLKGELLLRQDDSNAAEVRSYFERAIQIARNQSAKSWELRATMSLARLLDKQGRRDEARAMLADIYNWFTEGFDTADLKDAKALLDELNVKPVRVNEKR
jgi:predicted ATPase